MDTFSRLRAQALPIDQRYIWLWDDNGVLHLVDLLEPPSNRTFIGERDVDLRLYTQSNPRNPEHILASNDAASPSFKPRNPTRFVVHGWVSSEQRVTPIRDAYFTADLDYNVVVVDWSGPASGSYVSARNDTRLVGQYLAQVIQHLITARALNLDNVHIIGHSLGAHVAGVAGNRLHGQVAEVIGLDTAAPLFYNTPLEDRLDSTDGRVVQCIHTNGGMQGWGPPLGDMDFYPNGGTYQPGCGEDTSGGCSHNRVPSLYAESIVSTGFVATRCNSYASYRSGVCRNNQHILMGEWALLNATGNFFLDTNAMPPYAQGHTGL